ncbi:MAG: tRNA (adenosine(37)-N6)-dimethylallyltransferase MiaA [Bacteriovoracaceae bacterium]|nr:tRNA (adenosine(37)-N6)-dimethylallyltransferase MiaA [Bacteriovoracaceae bacterium]
MAKFTRDLGSYKMNSKSPLKIAIFMGPTATGKSSLAIEAAKKFSAEIINFDSLLFYKELNIGVAKPTLADLNSVPHHLVNVTTIDRPWDAAIFRERALTALKSMNSTSRVILVGGSGFYLRALTDGMYPSSTVPTPIRQKSDELYQSSGIAPFWELLTQVDPLSYQKLSPNDHYRIRRAVEHWWCHQTAFSESQSLWETEKNSQKLQNLLPANLSFLYLDLPKDEHWPIILERTRTMVHAGLLEEVSELLKTFSGEERPLQSIGYKESQAYLRGEIPGAQSSHSVTSEEKLIERIYLATRQLAKSQRTWFQKMPKETFHPLQDKHKIFSYLENFFASE